jgi:hypothetical protein
MVIIIITTMDFLTIKSTSHSNSLIDIIYYSILTKSEGNESQNRFQGAPIAILIGGCGYSMTRAETSVHFMNYHFVWVERRERLV